MNNTFQEKDIMHDLLATEKQTISAYSTGITELLVKILEIH